MNRMFKGTALKKMCNNVTFLFILKEHLLIPNI